ncbi:LptF/LptG family permease [Parafilimonas sp.]|uniref:LptF/LptG family permease n=1 Tax=Parafilimonas sp. TaxID=1969739 RepID=UPI0039E39AB6
MFKKLDILIVKAFVGPFIATFLISLFVLVMQFFWLYIDDLVGKGLDIITILKLISYVAATAVPLALPLALLLSSIMTFGNLGESFELVAIKSAGIPLLRFMAPLLIVAVLISGVAFLFANNIIPVANLKLNALKYDIIVTKPALDIKEGVFYDKIEGFVIKVGKKEKDDSTIHNVVIYEKNNGPQDDFLVANSGVMKVTPDKRFLQFTLHDGWRYQENGNKYSTNTDFIRLGFKDYQKDFDLSSFQMNKTEDSLFKWDPKMLTVHQLNLSIDSITKLRDSSINRLKSQLRPALIFLKYRDSAWMLPDSLKNKPLKNMRSIIPDSMSSTVYERASSSLSSIKGFVDLAQNEYSEKQNFLRKNRVEWNRKFSLSFACIVLFMIGAPLGSIIRKGGLGSPLVFAVIFFVIFHLLNTFGEKFSKQGVTSAAFGMWLSSIVLVPVGIFLTSKAMRDSQLFNKEFYFRFFKRVKSTLKKTQPADEV